VTLPARLAALAVRQKDFRGQSCERNETTGGTQETEIGPELAPPVALLVPPCLMGFPRAPLVSPSHFEQHLRAHLTTRSAMET